MINDYKFYNDNQEHTILVVDDMQSIHTIMRKILNVNNYNILDAYNGKEAIRIIENKKVDLIITDIEMPEMNGFGLVKYINDNNIQIPYFMMSTLEIEKYINMALEHNVGNIISKPLKQDVILSEVFKYIKKQELFGLENHIPLPVEPLKISELTTSEQIKTNVEEIVDHSIKCGFSEQVCNNLKVILIEMISNAVYHAHGREDMKLAHEHFELPIGEKVEIKYGYDKHKFGIGITDFKGTLRKNMILASIKEIFESEKRFKEAMIKGEDISDILKTTGRGIFMTMDMANEYFINIQRGLKAEVIILTPYNEQDSGEGSSKTSLKINEFF